MHPHHSTQISDRRPRPSRLAVILPLIWMMIRAMRACLGGRGETPARRELEETIAQQSPVRHNRHLRRARAAMLARQIRAMARGAHMGPFDYLPRCLEILPWFGFGGSLHYVRSCYGRNRGYAKAFGLSVMHYIAAVSRALSVAVSQLGLFMRDDRLAVPTSLSLASGSRAPP